MAEDEFKKLLRKWEQLERSFREMIRREIEKFEKELDIVRIPASPSWSSEGVLKPLYSVRDEGDSYVIYVDIPKADEGTIEVNFMDNKVEIKARLRKEFRFEGWSGRGGETTFTKYREVIELPIRIDPQRVRVRKRKGIVEIRIPK